MPNVTIQVASSVQDGQQLQLCVKRGDRVASVLVEADAYPTLKRSDGFYEALANLLDPDVEWLSVDDVKRELEATEVGRPLVVKHA